MIDKSYGLINFDAIGVTDNSGDEVVVVSSPPGYELGRSYRIGITTLSQPLAVTFTAADKSKNEAKCRFLIEIKGIDSKYPSYYNEGKHICKEYI